MFKTETNLWFDEDFGMQIRTKVHKTDHLVLRIEEIVRIILYSSFEISGFLRTTFWKDIMSTTAGLTQE